MEVALYNSAGERVRQLFSGSAQAPPQGAGLSAGLLLEGESSVELQLGVGAVQGQGSLAWDGSNDGGQAVANGIYYFKVEWVDSFGGVQTLSLAVQVQAATGARRLQIFNSAGELVAQTGLAGSASSLELGAATLVAGTRPDGGPVQTLAVTLGGGAGSEIWTWNGRNLAGAAVDPGVYSVVLSCDEAGGSRTLQVASLTVIKAPELALPGGAVLAAPNPVPPGALLRLRFSPVPGCVADGSLYNLAGERVDHAAVDGADGGLVFRRGDLASGAYLVELRFLEGGRPRRVVQIKVAILH